MKNFTPGWLTGRPNTMNTKLSLCIKWVQPYLFKDGSNLDPCVAIWERNLEPNSVKSVLYVAKAWVYHKTGEHLEIKAHITRVARSKQQLPVKTLNLKEIVALTRTCKASDPKLYLPLMIALHTGLRRGEVFGLLWGDIDILKGKIEITKSYKGPTKNGKSRFVPISEALEKVLLAIIPIKSYNAIEPLMKLFDPNPRLRRLCKLAGMREDTTFHSLRHTWATLALESGASPQLVSKTLGHSKVSTTLDIYWGSTGEILDLGFLPDE